MLLHVQLEALLKTCRQRGFMASSPGHCSITGPRTCVTCACIMAFSRVRGIKHSSTLSCTMALSLQAKQQQGAN
jgi:hypothetical protein